MQEPAAELAAYCGPWYQGPDAGLLRLTAAARAAGHGRDAIADACGNGPGKDVPGVIGQQYWIKPDFGPGPPFGATQRAVRNLGGCETGCYDALTWPCPGCGQHVTDLAPGDGPSRPSSATRRGWPRYRRGCVRGWTATRRWPAGPPARLCRSMPRIQVSDEE
jgi:hypothetical protein